MHFGQERREGKNRGLRRAFVRDHNENNAIKKEENDV